MTTTARARWTMGRVPLLVIGMLSMACGVGLGLVRVGWNLPLPWPDQLIAHGPLMVGGFLGTLISLERAVALGAAWGYAAPVFIATGALVMDLGSIALLGSWLITTGSLVMAAICGIMLRRQPSLFLVTMTLAAAAWVVGNVQWLQGAAIFRVVFWWLAFLVLTIAAERLELNRVLRQTVAVRVTFVGAIVLVLTGTTAASRWPELGLRVLGLGLVVLTWWLARHDIARRTMRQQGVTRFMAVCLLGGYAWLGVGGILAITTGAATPGVLYDATLHAVFLGFVMSMVFAHAPIIFPAVLGVAMPYRRRFYLHVAVLHLSLVLRLLGDLVDSLGRWRVWGGLLNAIALLLFVANTVSSVAMSRARGPHPNGRLALRGLSRRRSLSRARGLGGSPPAP